MHARARGRGGARPDNPARALQFSVRVRVRVHVLPVYVSLVLRVCPGLPSPSPTDSINIESLGA